MGSRFRLDMDPGVVDWCERKSNENLVWFYAEKLIQIHNGTPTLDVFTSKERGSDLCRKGIIYVDFGKGPDRSWPRKYALTDYTVRLLRKWGFLEE